LSHSFSHSCRLLFCLLSPISYFFSFFSSFLFSFFFFFFFNDPATTEFYTLSYTTLFRSAAVILCSWFSCLEGLDCDRRNAGKSRSEEHTSELQSLTNLVCRLLLEKKKKKNYKHSEDIKNRNKMNNRRAQ